MQDTETIRERDGQTTAPPRSTVRRSLIVVALLFAVPAMVLSLPLININRFQRRIVRSLSESFGRPIHLDRISLSLLPLPGLTIENLVVGEDPAFGAEPFVRAGTVRATLRVSSLWRRRVEFSRISFTEPSINLVHAPDGRWNLESILLQAARLEAAPTAQAQPGTAPRFPYIEATGARINLKQGPEKTPFSLTEAEVGLWLRSPQEWQLRLEGKPLRTDISLSETGSFQMEGTLGRAAALKEVPINLKAAWRNVPLGEASRMVLGRDAGLRGSITLSAMVRGSVAQSALQTTLHLTEVRRADFVPARTLSMDAECQATEFDSFHALSGIRCSWPPALADGKKTLALTGTIPDVAQLSSASVELGTPGIPASTLLDWLRIASPRVAPGIAAEGSLTGSTSLQPTAAQGAPWTGEFVWQDGSLSIPTVSGEPVFTGVMMVRSTPASPGQPSQFLLAPVQLALGGGDAATLDARFDASGYMLHLAGTAPPSKLLALATALPQLGDGLADVLPSDPIAAIRFDLTSTRTWTGPRIWKPTGHTPQTDGSRNGRRHSSNAARH